MTRYKRGVSVSRFDFGREKIEKNVLGCGGMCVRGGVLGKLTKKAESVEIKGCGAWFMGLSGCLGGFMVGVYRD